MHELTYSIILSKMSTEAQSASYKARMLGDKKLIGEEMLKYYKAPFSVYLCKSYFILLREQLEE